MIERIEQKKKRKKREPNREKIGMALLEMLKSFCCFGSIEAENPFKR